MKTNTQEINIIKSILIVDDSPEMLVKLKDKLTQTFTEATIITTKFPTLAIQLSKKALYDIILIDITINYNGSPFGGFEIYKSLLDRYGDSSLVAYSKYITDDLLRQYNFRFNFIEQGDIFSNFVNKLTKMIRNLRKNQKCFVAMPFSSQYNELFKIINICVSNNYYQCIRIDMQNFTKSIIEKIFSELLNSKLVVFVSTDKSPNAFYECGYADALSKEIITLTDYYKNLPFNIRDKNAIAYNKDFKKLKILLEDRLKTITICNEIIS